MGGKGATMGDRPVLRAFIAAQIVVPTVLLLWRVLAGPAPFYGWGWEMFS